MLSMHEISTLVEYQKSLPESKERTLLDRMICEYIQYIQCGTVDDCKQRMDWMSYSIDDIRNNFNSMVKGLREEVENIRTHESTPPKKKLGRPCKNK